MYENNENNYQAAQDIIQTQEVLPVQDKKIKKKRGAGKFFTKILIGASVGLCFGICAGVGIYAVGESTGMFDNWQRVEQVQQTSSDLTQDSLDTKQNEENTGVINTNDINLITSDVSDVVEAVMPSMVSIINNYVVKTSYFGQMIEQEESASATGIVVGKNDTELLIATNYHVVVDAKTLNVRFIDDTDVEATVKGSDSEMDLAVIAVPLSELSEETQNAISIAKLGDSDRLRLGEPVIAIGNALGYGQSVTGGWVSALNCEVVLEDGSTGTFIQTDAAINPGNSGGALLNIKGEVIGINSNKIGGMVIEGIGYAIPISAAQPILETLMTRDRVEVGNSGYLGIVPQSLTADVADIYGMPIGVFVSRIDDGTPAQLGGVLHGDIIIKLDDYNISTAERLGEILKYYEAGETVELTVMRNENGEYTELTLSVTLGSKPDTE